MNRIKNTLLFLVIGCSTAFGQSDIAFYCDVMNNAFEAPHRLKASNEFEMLFEKALDTPESFSNKFDELKWISIKYPEDASFRIITWPFKDGNENYTYKGIIQTNTGEQYKLIDKSVTMTDAEYELHDPDYWYGALYYKIMEKKVDNSMSYFLFGYNGGDKDIQIKLIDELHFENGKPVFGQESFILADGNERPTIKNRLIIDYSDNANVNCNFNIGLDMIVHDYVTPRFGISGSGKPVKIPDGTYVGYKWNKGNWNRVEKIQHQISSPESIYYQPKTDDNRDLFGKDVKKN